MKWMSVAVGSEPVGHSAPVDLSGFTPAAWNARMSSKSGMKAKDDEKLRRQEIKSLL
jgi:hypothetical protein